MEHYFKGKWLHSARNELNVAKFLNLSEKIILYDLGSAGGTPPPFCWIMEGLDVVNFEPDPRSLSPNEKEALPVAIGPKELDKIYLNKRPTTSSLLQPFRKVVDRYDFSYIFSDETNIFETVAIQHVDTYGLDDIIVKKDLSLPDFLKIDVQGLSLEVLESAINCLRNSVIGIQIEVEFLQTYQGQKTFGFVHEFLYDLGFEIFRLSNLNKWYYKTGTNLMKVTGQDVFCDLLYLRNIDSIENQPDFWSEEKALKALLLHLLYDLNDTAAAFHEKFCLKHIFDTKLSNALENLISNWENAFDFFYNDKTRLLDKILDTTPRKVIKHLKRFIRSNRA